MKCLKSLVPKIELKAQKDTSKLKLHIVMSCENNSMSGLPNWATFESPMLVNFESFQLLGTFLKTIWDNLYWKRWEKKRSQFLIYYHWAFKCNSIWQLDHRSERNYILPCFSLCRQFTNDLPTFFQRILCIIQCSRFLISTTSIWIMQKDLTEVKNWRHTSTMTLDILLHIL